MSFGKPYGCTGESCARRCPEMVSAPQFLWASVCGDWIQLGTWSVGSCAPLSMRDDAWDKCWWWSRVFATKSTKRLILDPLNGVRGSPERDILSLGAMGWGPGWFPALFTRRRVRFFEICVFFLRFSEVFKVLALKNKKDTFLKKYYPKWQRSCPEAQDCW